MRRLLKLFSMTSRARPRLNIASLRWALSIVIVASVNGVGTALSGKFGTISTSLK